MLSPEELLEFKKKPVPSVYSFGKKESEQLNLKFDAAQLEMKLKNVEELLSVVRVKMIGALSKAFWNPQINKAEVTENIGPYWETFGHSVGSKKYLYPEEALYLVDISALELKFNGVLLSLQRAYHLLLNNTGVSMEEYRVFSHLSVLGYKVLRHSTKNVLTKYEKDIDIHKIGIKHRDVKEEHKKTVNTEPSENEVQSELTIPILYEVKEEHKKTVNSQQSEDEVQSEFSIPILYEVGDAKETVLERLQAIGPRLDDYKDNEMDFPVNFDVFLPTSEKSQFRKSTVQLPDFRIRVFSEDDPVPALPELCRQRSYFEDEVPLINAIVRPDFINFLQIGSPNMRAMVYT